MWDLIVSVPDHCLSFYLKIFLEQQQQPKANKKELETPPPLKQSLRNLSLGYTQIEKK